MVDVKLWWYWFKWSQWIISQVKSRDALIHSFLLALTLPLLDLFEVMINSSLQAGISTPPNAKLFWYLGATAIWVFVTIHLPYLC